jgi:hypothetical protein
MLLELDSPLLLLLPSCPLSFSLLRPGRFIIKYSHVIPRFSHREQVGFSLGHRTFAKAQAWQLPRIFDVEELIFRRVDVVKMQVFRFGHSVVPHDPKSLANGWTWPTGVRTENLQSQVSLREAQMIEILSWTRF